MLDLIKSLTLILGLNLESEGGPLIPGLNCGIETPFDVIERLTEADNLAQMGCTLVEDEKSFREHYLNKIPGKISLVIISTSHDLSHDDLSPGALSPVALSPNG